MNPKHLKAVKRKKSHFTQGDFKNIRLMEEQANHWLGEFSANMEAQPHVFMNFM